ncbi:MAG TPA: energy transducer TonB [Chitinophagaceae bacterium]|nr:energy transducer TonB [Chitinophagaceae bacterium]
MTIQKFAFLFCLLLISPCLYSQNDSIDSPDPAIFTKVDKDAAFPGGDPAWKNFLQKNLNANVPADRGAPTGVYTVMLQFIVNKEGKVSDIKPLTNQGYGTEQEVVRLLRLSGSWEPAMLDGKPVNAYRKQPVTFMITEDGFDISPYSIYADKDNEITIDVRNVKDENLSVTISRGTIKRNAEGKFIARVSGDKRVIITVYNAKKNNKELGMASLEVIPSGEATPVIK